MGGKQTNLFGRLVFETVESRPGPHKNLTSAEDWRGEHSITEGILGDDLATRSWFDHKRFSFFVRRIDMASPCNQRSGEITAKPAFPNRFSSLPVEAGENAVVADDVEHVFITKRRGNVGSPFGFAPHEVCLRDIATSVGANANQFVVIVLCTGVD